VKNFPKKPLGDKMKATEDFYDTYGAVLTDILYRTNNAGSSKDSDLNKIIALEMKE
jgi:hypothetical protein